MSNIVNNQDNLRHIQPEQARYYIQQLFSNVIDYDLSWMAEVRKVGKYKMLNGTTEPCEQVSTAQLLMFDHNDPIPGLADWVAQRVIDAAPIGVGAFMAPALLNDRRATEQSVRRLVSVCADFDTGNPEAKLEELIKRLGGVRPTIIARSGGITEEGYYKLHAHYRLDEPCDEPWKVAYVREQIAKMFGADTSFKRIPQIIRLPGSLYDKDLERGRITMVDIIEANERSELSLGSYEENLQLDYKNISEDSLFNRTSTKSKEERQERKHNLQTQEIHSGGTEETRFGRFSEYAGHQIRQARFGHQTEDEAQQSVHLWVQDKMVPAWDQGRVDAEFRALLQRDKVNHADAWAELTKPPITLTSPTPFNASAMPAADPAQYGIGSPFVQPDVVQSTPMSVYRARVLYSGEAPKERHLVENFIVHGGVSALVAAGGVGKTFLTLDLAMRCAAGPCMLNGRSNSFLGFPILERMNVVVLTVEDGQHDIHRRLQAIDSDGSLREATGDRCAIIPVREALMDGLTLVGKDTQGNYTASAAWRSVIDMIQEYITDPTISIDPEDPLLVVIDTYSATHHGDENNAVAVNEWFRAAGLLKKLDASLLMTHHTRKSDPKAEIKTVEDMLAAVRGSTAYINSCRFVVGVWRMPNGDAILKEMPGREPGQILFNMGILKNNTGISWAERSNPKFQDPLLTLKRLGDGRLVYDDIIHSKRLELGEGKKERIAAAEAQMRAAIKHVVRISSEEGYPLSAKQLEREKGILPDIGGATFSQKRIKEMIEEMVNVEGSLVSVAGVVPRGEVLDVPEGAFASGVQNGRVPVRKKFTWAHWKYDDENECYNLIPNSQGAMDF